MSFGCFLSHTSGLFNCGYFCFSEIGDVFRALAIDPDCRVVVLTGNGRAFTSGLDLKGRVPCRSGVSSGSLGSVISEDLDPARRARTTLTKLKWMQEDFSAIEQASFDTIHIFLCQISLVPEACDRRRSRLLLRRRRRPHHRL